MSNGSERLIQLVRDCQRDIARYLDPGSGISKDDLINQLLQRLDGPQAREALAEAGARMVARQ